MTQKPQLDLKQGQCGSWGLMWFFLNWRPLFFTRVNFPLWLSLLHSQSICERVTPRLSHANSAVVLSAVKVLMKFLELLPKDSDYYNTLLKKLSPPLVTLLSGEPEVQYVALRNINLIVQKRCVITISRSSVVSFIALKLILLLPTIGQNVRWSLPFCNTFF